MRRKLLSLCAALSFLLVGGAVAGQHLVLTPMATIPAGSYLRCPSCEKGNQSIITLHAFRIDRDEVTIGQYRACVSAKKCSRPKLPKKILGTDVYDAQPVREITWSDADAYCKFIGRRLPTLAEWERSAFPPGSSGEYTRSQKPCFHLLIGGYWNEKCPATYDGPDHVVIQDGTAELEIAGDDWVPVQDDDKATAIYDLLGNVSEWVSDWASYPGDAEYYFQPQTKVDPTGPTKPLVEGMKAVCGGSFARLRGSRSGECYAAGIDHTYKDIGFRCAADVPPASPRPANPKK